MPPTPATNLRARLLRCRGSVALLVATFGLAVGGQGLGPAPAAAMIDQASVGVCEPMPGISDGGWNFTTNEACSFGQDAGGGPDGEGSGGGSDDEIIGEPIEVEGTAPPTDCAVNIWNCLPAYPPTDTPPSGEGAPGPSGPLGFWPQKGTVDAIKKREREKKEAECRTLEMAGKVWRSTWVERERIRISALEAQRDAIYDKSAEGRIEDWEIGRIVRLNRDIAEIQRGIRQVLRARKEWDAKNCAALWPQPEEPTMEPSDP
jgi:hypothetical protein